MVDQICSSYIFSNGLSGKGDISNVDTSVGQQHKALFDATNNTRH